MTKIKKITAIGAMVLVIGATSITAFAASKYSSPAEAVAGLTGKTTASVIQEKQDTGKSYGAIAAEAGKLEEFKKERLQIVKDNLAKRVADGTITQARADEIIKAVEERQAVCDGTGTGGAGCGMGAGLGRGNGRGCGGAGCGLGN
jgi:hypothetical protein